MEPIDLLGRIQDRNQKLKASFDAYRTQYTIGDEEKIRLSGIHRFLSERLFPYYSNLSAPPNISLDRINAESEALAQNPRFTMGAEGGRMVHSDLRALAKYMQILSNREIVLSPTYIPPSKITPQQYYTYHPLVRKIMEGMIGYELLLTDLLIYDQQLEIMTEVDAVFEKDGKLYFAEIKTDTIRKVFDGPIKELPLGHPFRKFGAYSRKMYAAAQVILPSIAARLYYDIPEIIPIVLHASAEGLKIYNMELWAQPLIHSEVVAYIQKNPLPKIRQPRKKQEPKPILPEDVLQSYRNSIDRQWDDMRRQKSTGKNRKDERIVRGRKRSRDSLPWLED